jgi:hypothetical protein
MTSHFLTEKGETVELVCGLDHDFEGWPRRIRVRDDLPPSSARFIIRHQGL